MGLKKISTNFFSQEPVIDIVNPYCPNFMLLSGFSMMRNASKLYYPAKESIQSILPIVDEFIVALGEGEPDDQTEISLRDLNDPKIKIMKRHWAEQLFKDGSIFAYETTFALQQCKSTWCIYLQADEVVHEDDLPVILEFCNKYKDNLTVDGMLFEYYHFWGDYNHHLNIHGICRKEIRVIRNGIGAYSFRDALSFRKGMNQKLNVIKTPAHIFHYGYVRPPRLMAVKKKIQDSIHQGRDMSGEVSEAITKSEFDFGPLGDIPTFTKTHPKVMKDFIGKFNWQHDLDYSNKKLTDRGFHKHQRLKYRILTWIEKKFNHNEEIIGWKNYKLIKP